MIYGINLIITANFVFKFSSHNILVNVPKYKEKNYFSLHCFLH